jgi:hypothetical protein
VKRRVVLGALAVMGTLALSATVAQAGGRGNPSALTSFFSCQTINGASVGTTVDVYSNEVAGGPQTPSRTNVTIGQAILACAQVYLFHAGVTPVPDPNDPTIPLNNIPTQISDPTPFELKCYATSVAKKSGEAGSLSIEDALFNLRFGRPEAVTVTRDPKMICAPASLH